MPEMALHSELGKTVHESSMMFLIPAEQEIYSPDQDNGAEDHNIQLKIQAGMEFCTQEPDQNNQGIDQKDQQGGYGVAYPSLYEDVVQMCLVRMEGTLAVINPTSHDP